MQLNDYPINKNFQNFANTFVLKYAAMEYGRYSTVASGLRPSAPVL